MSRPVFINSSEKSTATTSRRCPKRKEKRAVADPVLATSLSPGSSSQYSLVSDRICKGLCAECGKPRSDGGYEFCESCLTASLKITELETLDAWQYRVRQIKPAIPGFSSFIAERIGVYEREGKHSFIALCDDFENAKSKALKMYNRAAAYFAAN
jgi:hypothetical protein